MIRLRVRRRTNDEARKGKTGWLSRPFRRKTPGSGGREGASRGGPGRVSVAKLTQPALDDSPEKRTQRWQALPLRKKAIETGLGSVLLLVVGFVVLDAP